MPNKSEVSRVRYFTFLFRMISFWESKGLSYIPLDIASTKPDVVMSIVGHYDDSDHGASFVLMSASRT